MRLGDEANGFLAEENVRSVAEIVPWLQEAIAHFDPTSSYAESSSREVRERAANRLFLPPKIGSSIICTHCGALHAAPPGMDELLWFYCGRRGNSVEVKLPKLRYESRREGSRYFALATSRRKIPNCGEGRVTVVRDRSEGLLEFLNRDGRVVGWLEGDTRNRVG